MLAPYKREVKELVEWAFKEQTPMQLKRIRDKFYDLLVNCIDGSTILKQMVEEVLAHAELRQETVKEIIHQAA